jgi:hypothetical protein
MRVAVTLPPVVQLLARYRYIGKVFPHHTNDERRDIVSGVLISLHGEFGDMMQEIYIKYFCIFIRPF